MRGENSGDLCPKPQQKANPNQDLTLETLRHRIAALENAIEKPKAKDFWDKLQTLSGLISGALIAGIGFYATQVYDRLAKDSEREQAARSVAAMELQTIERFFPHLTSRDEQTKQGAIEAISSLGNPGLATRMAVIFGGSGARAAVANIANRSDTTNSSVQYALTELFREFKDSILYIESTSKDADPASSHGFFVSSDGYALTSADLFLDGAAETPLVAHVSASPGSSFKASLAATIPNNDLALVKVHADKVQFRPLHLSSEPLETGQSITIMRYFGSEPSVVVGIVSSMTSPQGTMVLSAPIVSPSGAGSPVFNNHGEVAGVIVHTDDGTMFVNVAWAVPVSAARPLLAIAGIGG